MFNETSCATETLAVPKTAVIGVSGFIGSAFFKIYRGMYPDCAGTSRRPDGDDIFTLDLLNPNIAPLRLGATKHREALIFAGMSRISECERDPKTAREVNVEGTLELIRQLSEEGIKAIFASSDYVFDGCSGSYSDDTPLHPVTEYGIEKAEVEKRIKEFAGKNYLIIRLSKIFSLQKGDGTLLDEMAGILASGGTIRAAYDQIFCPMLIGDLIRAVINLQMHSTRGVVNICSPERWSRYDLAIEVARAMAVDLNRVKKISLDEIGIGPRRPKDTSMKIERLLREADLSFTPMSECIKKVSENWSKA